MSAPAERPLPSAPVPAPPGGHALRIDPRQMGSENRPAVVGHVVPPSLPVVEETSAGGIVVRRLGGAVEAAIIARRNRAGRLEWCLPKGHLEGVETPQQAAVREVSEETGIFGTVRAVLGVIDYWFTGSDRRVHKVVHHFLLDAVGGELTVENDPDAEAETAAWIPVADLPSRLSYPNERRIAVLARSVSLRSDPAEPGAAR